jgi:hypothetical protein
MSNYDITKELKESTLDFVTNYADYGKILELLRDQDKNEFTEDEVNSILNLLGTFRVMDVYPLIERFRIEVTPLKPQTSEQSEDITEQAG